MCCPRAIDTLTRPTDTPAASLRRRLFPCFKVRVEAKHRGPFSLPLTLRAHVLTQQDKEHIGTWVPPEEDPNLDDKGQQVMPPYMPLLVGCDTDFVVNMSGSLTLAYWSGNLCYAEVRHGA